jgi:hypothetical protein
MVSPERLVINRSEENSKIIMVHILGTLLVIVTYSYCFTVGLI